MNSKGQMTMVGTFLVVFLVVVVGLALFSGGIAPNIGASTSTAVNANESVTFPAIGSALVLKGQAVSDLTILNATANGTVISSTNYTITNYDASTGTLRAYITANNASVNETGSLFTYNGRRVLVSYTYEPLGYAKESGTRTVISLIAIFTALAIVAIVIGKIGQDGLFDYFR